MADCSAEGPVEGGAGAASPKTSGAPPRAAAAGSRSHDGYTTLSASPELAPVAQRCCLPATRPRKKAKAAQASTAHAVRSAGGETLLAVATRASASSAALTSTLARPSSSRCTSTTPPNLPPVPRSSSARKRGSCSAGGPTSIEPGGCKSRITTDRRACAPWRGREVRRPSCRGCASWYVVARATTRDGGIKRNDTRWCGGHLHLAVWTGPTVKMGARQRARPHLTSDDEGHRQIERGGEIRGKEIRRRLRLDGRVNCRVETQLKPNCAWRESRQGERGGGLAWSGSQGPAVDANHTIAERAAYGGCETARGAAAAQPCI